VNDDVNIEASDTQ